MALQSKSEEKLVAHRNKYVMEGRHDDNCGGSPQRRQRRDISGSKSETLMTDLSANVGGRRSRRQGIVGGGTSGEVAVDGAGCGGVYQRWLKEVKGYLFCFGRIMKK